MNRNYVLKVILISTAIVLTVGVAGGLAVHSQKIVKGKQVVKTDVEKEKIHSDKVENINSDKTEDISSNEVVNDKVENINYQHNKEKVNVQPVKVEALAVKENKDAANDVEIEIEEVNDENKVDSNKKELKPVVEVENLKSEDESKQLVTKSGYVRDYYEKDGELYIIFDEAEFFRNEEAKEEYYKDGNTEKPEEEWGNDYYIRNKDKSTKVYKVSKDSKLELLSFEVGKDNSIDLVKATADEVKKKIDKFKGIDYLERGLLFNIDENDDVVYGMRSIYTP